MAVTKSDKAKAVKGLAREVSRVASALERQSSAKHRFLMGLVFGVGTAIGASLIASIIIITIARTLSAIGIDPGTFGQDAGSTIEQQIKLQTPQD
ncbi:hypothetical protein HQ524_01825 [Candidatus Uhrbacteria bacterium]|nr:hypothetical protein [Candidatus Uhrbacteria bacterium]